MKMSFFPEKSFSVSNSLNWLIVLLLVLPLSAQAQDKKNYRNLVYRSNNHYSNGNGDHTLKVTVGASAVSYTGELANLGQFIRPMFSGGIIYKIAPHVSLKSELSFYSLKGDDAKGKNSFRNLSFESRNFEGYAGIMYELLDVDMYSRGQAIIVNPYVFGGLGFTTLNPTTELNGNRYTLRDFRTEDITYSGATMIAPVGAGIRFELTRRIGLSLEAGYRFTFSDYLDDVSTNYINTSTVDPIRAALADRGPEIGTPRAEPNSQRGNPRSKDGYLSLGLKFEYLLFPRDDVKKPKCPTALQRRAPKVKK